jgi:hypothetical protein
VLIFAADCDMKWTLIGACFFLKWGNIVQASASKGCTQLFLLDYSQNFTRTIQKINLEATLLYLHWNEEGDNTPTHIQSSR